MRNGLAFALVALVGVLPAASQQEPRRFVQVQLLKTVKAKKAKAGDVIKARARQAVILPGGLTIPEDATLLGELRAVDENSLAISFDRVEINGKTTPVKLSIVSAMLPVEVGGQPNTGGGESASVDDATPGNRPMRGGVPHATTVTASAPEGSATTGGPLVARTGMVIGLPGVTLEVDDGPQHASKFVSAGKELQLKSGLQFMLATVE